MDRTPNHPSLTSVDTADSGQVALLRADLADLEGLARGRLWGARVFSIIAVLFLATPFVAGGFPWYLLPPLLLWALVTVQFWKRYVEASAEATRRKLELEGLIGVPPKGIADILDHTDNPPEAV